MFSMLCSRHDIAEAGGAVINYMENPKTCNWTIVKWTVHYLTDTSNTFTCDGAQNQFSFVDIDFEGDRFKRKFIIGSIVSLTIVSLL